MAALSAPMNGNSVLVEIDGAVVGSQTGVTFNENMETIDVTTKQSLGVTALKHSKYSATCSMNAMFIDDDTAFASVRTKLRSGDRRRSYRLADRFGNRHFDFRRLPTGLACDLLCGVRNYGFVGSSISGAHR